jgi:hypothetical protein
VSRSARRHIARHSLPPTPAQMTARRRTVIALSTALAVLVAGTGVYFFRFYESPPDVAAAGAGYWVSTKGDDDGTGSAERPWRTIDQAVASAPVNSRIFVRNGTYEPFTIDRPGMTVTSAPGEHATIEGRRGTRDVILITAAKASVTDLTVTGCVPNPDPDPNVSGDHGSGIRIDRTTGATVRGVTVRDGRGVNAAGLPVGCYGILATSSRAVLIASSEVFHNGAGIVISRGGHGVVVEHNDVHDQDVIVQNSADRLDDFGGYGLGASFITDKPGPVFRDNTVARNFGPSTDYGLDGGGMEIYDASNTTITGNHFSDNDGVMETGTGSGGGCANNVFTGNTATPRSSSVGMDSNTGLVLRCAQNLLVRDNTFTDLDNFTFLLASGGEFAGRIDGLRIEANTVTKRAAAVVYRLQFGTAKPAVTINRNRYRTGQATFAVIDDAAREDDGSSSGHEVTSSYDEWRARTGHDAASTLSN